MADKARKPRAFYDRQISEKGSDLLKELEQETQQIRLELQNLGSGGSSGPQENGTSHPK